MHFDELRRRDFITLFGGAAAWRISSTIWLAVVVGSLYILSAKLSLSLLTPTGVAVFWPAAGVAADDEGRRGSEDRLAARLSAIPVSRWRIACLPLAPASLPSRSAHMFSPRCSPSGGSTKPRSRRAKPACRRH
jgi:hypothetical protein